METYLFLNVALQRTRAHFYERIQQMKKTSTFCIKISTAIIALIVCVLAGTVVYLLIENNERKHGTYAGLMRVLMY